MCNVKLKIWGLRKWPHVSSPTSHVTPEWRPEAESLTQHRAQAGKNYVWKKWQIHETSFFFFCPVRWPDRHTALPPAVCVMQICNPPCHSNPSCSDVFSHSSPVAPVLRSPPSPLCRLLSPWLFKVRWISFVARIGTITVVYYSNKQAFWVLLDDRGDRPGSLLCWLLMGCSDTFNRVKDTIISAASGKKLWGVCVVTDV